MRTLSRVLGLGNAVSHRISSSADRSDRFDEKNSRPSTERWPLGPSRGECRLQREAKAPGDRYAAISVRDVAADRALGCVLADRRSGAPPPAQRNFLLQQCEEMNVALGRHRAITI